MYLHRNNPPKGSGWEINFLPFLDVLFSAMGIFLVILLLQDSASNKESTLNTATMDALIVCLPQGQYQWFQRASTTPVLLNQAQLADHVKALAHTLGQSPWLQVAFTAEAIPSQQTVRVLFLELSKQWQTEEMQTKIALQPLWWPLNDSDNSYATLTQQWLEMTSDESQRK